MADGQLTISRQHTMLPQSLQDAGHIAKYIAKSGLFDCKTKDQAFALMLLADAEGLHPAAAARDYHIIDGKPSLRADAMLARYMGAGGKIKWLQREPEIVSAEFTHPSSGSVTITWDKKRAELAGFWTKATWKKHPVQMLSARVISEGVRASFPGVVSGLYAPEEVQDFEPVREPKQAKPLTAAAEVITPDGEVIEAEPSEQVPTVSMSPLDADGISNRDWKAEYARLETGIQNCHTVSELRDWLEVFGDALVALPGDYCESLRGVFQRRRDELKALV